MSDPVEPDPGPSVADLKSWTGAPEADSAIVGSCLAEASELVTKHIGISTVPVAIKNRAILEVGAELYHRKNAPNGISQFADLSGNPVRVARDAMTPAYPLLRPYTGGGFA